MWRGSGGKYPGVNAKWWPIGSTGTVAEYDGIADMTEQELKKYEDEGKVFVRIDKDTVALGTEVCWVFQQDLMLLQRNKILVAMDAISRYLDKLDGGHRSESDDDIDYGF